MKLIIKGTKCFSDKCPIESATLIRNAREGRKAKIVGYGLQLREKNKKDAPPPPPKGALLYRKATVPHYFEKADAQGRDRRIAVAAMERRRDNVVYRRDSACPPPGRAS